MSEIWAKIFTENNINSSLYAIRNVVKEITEYKLENIKTEQRKSAILVSVLYFCANVTEIVRYINCFLLVAQTNGRTNSNPELPKDPKILTEMVMNLQKQVQEKDDTLRDISDKLSRKSEECESLMEEHEIMRNKSSFDLQQVRTLYDAKILQHDFN